MSSNSNSFDTNESAASSELRAKFAEVAQIEINILTGKAEFGDEERDPSSPTESPIYSHGANLDL